MLRDTYHGMQPTAAEQRANWLFYTLPQQQRDAVSLHPLFERHYYVRAFKRRRFSIETSSVGMRIHPPPMHTKDKEG